jgi:hypothetical protein
MSDAAEFDPDAFAGPAIVSLEQFKAAQFRSKFGAIRLGQIDAPGPEHEFLIEGILSIADKSVLGGESQSGKSFLAIEAALDIAHGRPFFGLQTLSGLVVYQSGEGSRGVKKRLRAWHQHNGIAQSDDTPFVLLQSRVDLYGREGDTDALIEEIQYWQALYDVPLRLVVIDTLATACVGAEENSAKDIGIVMDNIARINKRLGAHVMLVHHLNSGKTKLRGSTAVPANVDTTALITKDEITKVRTFSLGKQRDDDADAIGFQFELMQVALLGPDGPKVDRMGKPITSCVCLPVGEKETARKAEAAKGLYLMPEEVEFMRAYFRVERVYGQPPSANLDVDPKVRTLVKFSDFKAWLSENTPPLRILADDATEDERVKAAKQHGARIDQQIRRMGEQLRNPRKVFGRMRDPIMGKVKIGEAWFMFWLGNPLRAFPLTQAVAQPEPMYSDGEQLPEF